MADLYVYQILSWRVIDGDTLEVTIDRGFRDRTQTAVRIDGINTPEDRGDEKVAGIPVNYVVEKWLHTFSDSAIDVLEGASHNGTLYVRSLKLGKYGGRIIGDVWGEDKVTGEERHLGDYLLAEGLAKPYHGGTKEPFTEAELETIKNKANALLEG